VVCGRRVIKEKHADGCRFSSIDPASVTLFRPLGQLLGLGQLRVSDHAAINARLARHGSATSMKMKKKNAKAAAEATKLKEKGGSIIISSFVQIIIPNIIVLFFIGHRSLGAMGY